MTLLLVCLTLNNEKKLNPVLVTPAFHLLWLDKDSEEGLVLPCSLSMALRTGLYTLLTPDIQFRRQEAYLIIIFSSYEHF